MESYCGEERRVTQDEQLGYIKGKVESIQNELKEFKDESKEHLVAHTSKEEERLSAIESDVSIVKQSVSDIAKSVDMQANTHKYIWLTIKSVAGAIFLALTFKLGDILSIFK